MSQSAQKPYSIFQSLETKIKALLALLLGAALTGCSTLDPAEQDELSAMAKRTVEKLSEDNPALQRELESAPGWLVLSKRVVKVPVFGGGRGRGVVVDARTGEETFIRAARLEVGGGWGARSYKMLLVFQNPDRFEKVRKGTWIYEIGAEATAGKISVEGSTDDVNPKSGYKVYILTDGGASATYTLRVLRLKPWDS